MNFHTLSIPHHAERQAVCISRKRGCSHCHKRVDLLVSEDTCPNRFRCPWCRSQWIFVTEVRIDLEDLLQLPEAERAELLSDEGLLGVDVVAQ